MKTVVRIREAVVIKMRIGLRGKGFASDGGLRLCGAGLCSETGRGLSILPA